MPWAEVYRNRVRSAEEAVRAVKPGDRIFLTGNCSVPKVLLGALLVEVAQDLLVLAAPARGVVPEDGSEPESDAGLFYLDHAGNAPRPAGVLEGVGPRPVRDLRAIQAHIDEEVMLVGLHPRRVVVAVHALQVRDTDPGPDLVGLQPVICLASRHLPGVWF